MDVVKKIYSNFSKGQFDLYEGTNIPEGGAKEISNMVPNRDGSLVSIRDKTSITGVATNVVFFTSWQPKYKYKLSSGDRHYYITFSETPNEAISLLYWDGSEYVKADFDLPDSFIFTGAEYFVYKSPERVVVADGVNRGYSLTIDKEGELQYSAIGLDAPARKAVVDDSAGKIGYIETDTENSTGCTIERGSLVKIAYTYTKKTGAESNPSPVTVFSGDPQKYLDSTYDVGFKYYISKLTYNNIFLPEIDEEYGELRVYRATKEFKDENNSFTVLELAVTKDLDGYDGSEIEVTDSNQLQGDIISYENDKAPILYDVTGSGGRVFGVASDIDAYDKFPAQFDKIYKIEIKNPNAESNADGIVDIELKQSDFGTDIELDTIVGTPSTIRLIDSDLITPLPVIYKKYNDGTVGSEEITDPDFSGGLDDFDPTNYSASGSIVYTDVLSPGETAEIANSTSYTNTAGVNFYVVVRGEITAGGTMRLSIKNRADETQATLEDVSGHFQFVGLFESAGENDNITFVCENTGAVACQIKPIEFFSVKEIELDISTIFLQTKLPEIKGNQSKSIYLCYDPDSLPSGWEGSTRHGQWVDIEGISDFSAEQAVISYDKPFYSRTRNKIVADLVNAVDDSVQYNNFCNYDDSFEPRGNDIVDQTDSNNILFPDSALIENNNSPKAFSGDTSMKYASGSTLYPEDFGDRDEGVWSIFISTRFDLNILTEWDEDASTYLDTLLESLDTGCVGDLPSLVSNDGWVLYLKRDVTEGIIELILTICDTTSGSEYSTDITLATFKDVSVTTIKNLDILVSFDFSTNGDETGIINSFVYDNEEERLITARNKESDQIGVSLALWFGTGADSFYTSTTGAINSSHYFAPFERDITRIIWFTNQAFDKTENFFRIKNFSAPYLTDSIGLYETQVAQEYCRLTAGGEFTVGSEENIDVSTISDGDYVQIGSTTKLKNTTGCGLHRITSVDTSGVISFEIGSSDDFTSDKRNLTFFKTNKNISIEELERPSDFQINKNRLVWSDVFGEAFPDLNFKTVNAPIKRILEAPSFLKFKYENTVLIFTDNDISRFVLIADSDGWRTSTENLVKDKVGRALYAKRAIEYGDDTIVYLSNSGLIHWDSEKYHNITQEKNDIDFSENSFVTYDSNNRHFRYISSDKEGWLYVKDLMAIVEVTETPGIPHNTNLITGNAEVYSSGTISSLNTGSDFMDDVSLTLGTMLFENKGKVIRIKMLSDNMDNTTAKFQCEYEDVSRTDTFVSKLYDNKSFPLNNVWGNEICVELSNATVDVKKTINKIILDVLGVE